MSLFSSVLSFKMFFTPLLLSSILVSILIQIYFWLKPFLDFQKKVNHYNWANLKLMMTKSDGGCVEMLDGRKKWRIDILNIFNRCHRKSGRNFSHFRLHVAAYKVQCDCSRSNRSANCIELG